MFSYAIFHYEVDHFSSGQNKRRKFSPAPSAAGVARDTCVSARDVDVFWQNKEPIEAQGLTHVVK